MPELMPSPQPTVPLEPPSPPTSAPSPPENGESNDPPITATSNPSSSIVEVAQFLTAVFGSAWLSLAIGLLALFTHSTLIAVTASTQKLRSSVNLLLAAESLCLVVSQLGFLMTINYPYPVPFGVCAVVGVVSIIALQTGPVLTLALALDRLLAIVAPIWTWNGGDLRQWGLTLTLVIASLVAGVIFTWTMMGLRVFTGEHPALGVSVVCDVGEVFDPSQPSHPIADWKNYSLFVGAVVAYTALWAILRRREKASSTRNNKLFSITSKRQRNVVPRGPGGPNGTPKNVIASLPSVAFPAPSSSNTTGGIGSSQATVTGTINSNAQSAASLARSRRVFRALCVYAGVDAVVWLLGPLEEQCLRPLLQPDPELSALILTFIVAGTSAAMALKPLALYWFSNEYRKATNDGFRHCWQWLSGNVSSVWQHITNQHHH